MPTRRILAFAVLLVAGMAGSPAARADEKEIEGWRSSTWQMAISLHAPSLMPPAVQWAVMDEDPVPGFTARVDRMRSYYRGQIDKAQNEQEKDIARSAGMTVSWDLSFKEVKGDRLYLLTSEPETSLRRTSHGFSSNGPDGKKWIVTKAVRIKGKPACWCLPVEVKKGRNVDVTLSEDNLFDLASAYGKAMGETDGRGGQAKPDMSRLVCPLKAVPAHELASMITGLLQAEGQVLQADIKQRVVIVPEALSNSLVIAGPPDVVEEVRKLVEQLDRPAVMVRLEVLLVEIPATGKAAKTGPKPEGKRAAGESTETLRPDALPQNAEILARGELTTLDNQPAYLKIARREARITAVNMSQAGRSNSITYDNVGTSIGLTPRMAVDRTVTAQISIEDSRSGPRDQGVALAVPAQGEPVRTPDVETFTAQTTVRILDGKTLVIGGMGREPKNGKQRVLLVTPHVLPIGGGASVEREKRRQHDRD
jgi:type II secretory pathway component GspD/PulD (secretin)